MRRNSESVEILLNLIVSHLLCLFTTLCQIMMPDKTSFYDLVDKDMQGNEVKMESFKGDVLCVVNVASK